MEGEAKARGSRCRRRERAARMQKQAMRGGQSADEADESPGRSASKPPRPPNRKKRNKEPVFEEDVIDGFAILSFRTYEELEEFGAAVAEGPLRPPGPPEIDASRRDALYGDPFGFTSCARVGGFLSA
ncbi:hypothetical protein HPB52_011563 [Rhipicephalus sanguineus]|uniref:Uncharacterized protein n=1 Tax=Rhipicephalus sanguineus TaxID=34632 RepID=A0A9D4PVP0_RHISA|nr:hypothetical protein HPB52_011563 [Rhipicephalus sanguineus]